MGTLALLWCFVFTIARVYGQCCNSNLDYCPAQWSLDSPTVCTSFGTGHIHTWDGLSYDFHEYGDFYLVNNQYFSIQARQIECKSTLTQSVPIGSTTELQGTCNKAFVLSVNGATHEYRHDINTDYITYAVNKNVNTDHLEDYNVGGVITRVQPIQYVNPYKELWRDQQAYLNDADFSVTLSVTVFSLGETIQISLWFYATGHATIQILLNANSNVGTLYGLCGYRDGCSANDLVLRPNPKFNPTSDSLKTATPVIETVRPASGSQGSVSAGGLNDGERFINKTDSPQNWASVFGTTWRVPTSESNFEPVTGDNYNIRSVKTSYSDGGNNCDWPNGWIVPEFIQKQCSLDKDRGSDPDGFDQLPTKHVLFAYCQYYCDNFVFPFHNPQLLATSCNGICEFPQGDQTQDLHTEYTADNLPASFLGQNKPQALFTPQMNLGGTYEFRLSTGDYCSKREYNITRTINCVSGLQLTDVADPSTSSSNVKRNPWYGWPTVVVSVETPSNFVRSSFVIKVYPDPTNSSTPPPLSNTRSLHPTFRPPYPGLYRLEFAVYDGCHIAKQLINVTALCSDCVTASIIDLSPVKEVTWSLIFNSPDQDPILTAANFPIKTLNAASQGQDWPQWGELQYEWSIVTDDHSNDLIQETGLGTKTYNVNRFNDSASANFAKANPTGELVNTTNFTWNTAVSPPPGPVNRVTLPDLPPLKGPVNTQFGVVPPQREFLIHREGTSVTQVNTTTRQRVDQTIWKLANSYLACVAAISFGTDSSATVQFTPNVNPNDAFVSASRCVGQYNLNLSVNEPLCASAVDVQKIEVECGANPEVYFSCPRELAYHYNTRLFDPVTIDASLSRDPYNRQRRFQYVATVQPTGSNLVNPVCNNQQPNFCGTSTSYTPTIAGDYGIQVSLSNGCNSASATAYFRATCPGDVSQMVANFVANAPYTNYLFPYTGQAQPHQASFNGGTSTTNVTGAFLTYAWTLTKIPTQPLPPWLAAPSLTNPLTVQPTLTMTLPGTYTIQLRIDQGCGQTTTIAKDFTAECDAVITPSISPNNVLTVPWNTTIGGWTPPVLTPAPIYQAFTFTNNPDNTTGTPLAQYRWYRNGAPYAITNNPITLVVPGSNATESYVLWATDGCVSATAPAAQVNVTYVCFTGMDAQITANRTVTGIPTNTPVLFFSNTSTLSNSSVTIYSWSVVSKPVDYPSTEPLPPTGAADTYLWTPRWGGSYILSLTITDGCASDSVNLTFTVSCTVPLPLAARFLTPDGSSPPAIIWTRNGFSQVLLDSNVTRPPVIDTLVYEWRVLAAPYYSIYHPTTSETSVITNSTPISNSTTTSPDQLWTYLTLNTTFTETNTSSYFYALLINRNTLTPNTAFPACFYPDVAGPYDFQLTVYDTCQQKASVVTVPVQCASKPTPQLQVTEHALFDGTKESKYVTATGSNIWKIDLSRTQPRRVVLDARQSTNYSLSSVSYYWAWAFPDQMADTKDAQDSLETPYASTSAVTLTQGGLYHLYLTVHDGCDVNYLNFTLDAQCGEPANSLVNVTVNSDGVNLNTFQLSMKQGDNQIGCSQNVWEFYNFTPASTTSSASRVTLSISLTSLFLVFILFFLQ